MLLFLRQANQRGHQRNAIGLARRGQFGHMQHGGQHIPKRKRLIRHGAGFHFAFPFNNHRHPNAAFVQAPFNAPEWPGAPEEFRVVAAFHVRTVVAGEKHDCVLLDIVLAQLGEDLADGLIHAGDHRRLVAFRPRPAFTGVGECVVGHFHSVARLLRQRIIRVRRGVGDVQEKRFVFALRSGLVNADRVQGHLGNDVGAILNAPSAGVGVDGHVAVKLVDAASARCVSPQEEGIIIIGMQLVGKSGPMPEALAERFAGGAFFAEIPFAERDGLVVGGHQDLRDGDVDGAQGHAAVAADVRVAGVFAGKERSARGVANGAARVGLGEAHAFRRHAIEVWRLNHRLTVATQFPPAEVIGHDKNNIRRAWPFALLRLHAQRYLRRIRLCGSQARPFYGDAQGLRCGLGPSGPGYGK